MQRGDEIERQWKLLNAIASSADRTYDSLAADLHVTRRTIQRDIETLSLVFPVEEARMGRRKVWRLEPKALSKLAGTSFSLPELCAFYVHRGQLGCAGGSALNADLASALDKVGKALGSKMRKYLDQVTAVVRWKEDPAALLAGNVKPGVVEDLMRASIDRKQVRMDYHSFASGAIKSYLVEPARLTAGNGGLYLYAFVPAYSEMRTFAVQRIKKLSVTDQRFDSPCAEDDPYRQSIGIWAGGKVEQVEIEFGAQVTPYVLERKFDDSQVVVSQPDGSIVLRMKKAIDLPLRSWLLGFGHHVRVLRPTALAQAILEELEEARLQYAPRMPFDLPPSMYDSARQGRLEFRSVRRGRGSVRRGTPRSAPSSRA
jgi:predicted DNA-binding transcriptional regulator YafY